MTEYVTSDFHFGHNNMIVYGDRPWKNSHQMNNGMIEIFNSIVSKEDTTYILGDFAWCGPEKARIVEKLVPRMNGTKILILGNHDRLRPFAYVNFGFQSAHTSYQHLTLPVIMVHDPACYIACPKDMCILCGHVHTLFKKVGRVVNVGVDIWDYKPQRLEEMLELAKE